MSRFLLLICCISALQSSAQVESPTGDRLIFKLLADGQLHDSLPIILPASDTSSIEITTFKCYISDMAMWSGQEARVEQKGHFLVDASNPSSMILPMEVPKNSKIEAVSFLVGIDSLTSVSGAFGGDLDPTKGMYWTWNSGYINFKVEGSHPDSPLRDHAFEYHIGGYLPPHATARMIKLPKSSKGDFVVLIDLDILFDKSDVSDSPRVMSVGEKAKNIADLFPQLFHLPYAH